MQLSRVETKKAPQWEGSSGAMLFGFEELLKRLGSVGERKFLVRARTTPDSEISRAIVNDDANAVGCGEFVGGGLKKRDVHAAAREVAPVREGSTQRDAIAQEATLRHCLAPSRALRLPTRLVPAREPGKHAA